MTFENESKTGLKTGENRASSGFLDKYPIPTIGGMNIYEECYDEPAAGAGHAPSIEHVIAEAVRQKHRITACVCGGPRIHSKTTGRSKCFRCQLVEQGAAPLASTRQKCRRCKKYRRAVVKANYCDYCYERVQAQKEAA